jgi:nitrogen regulatory protein PII
MIMLILNDPEQCQSIMDAWDAAGVSGITLLPSTGLGRIRKKRGLIEEMSLMPSIEDFFEHEENVHRTLITIVRDHPIVEQVVQATQTILGDLNQPNTGILVVLPVLEAYGLDRYSE